jgi:hypothetical protein
MAPCPLTLEQRALRYLRAQAAKLLRLYDHGKLPIEEMRALDEISLKAMENLARNRGGKTKRGR